jgi:putative ATPase
MSNDLFNHAMHEHLKSEAPLAARMRPRTSDKYIGQEHIVGEGKLLRRAIEADKLFSSIILCGPPGMGKTTLAQVIANTTNSHFTTISAMLAGKADLRVVIDKSLERRQLHNIKTLLFVK